MIYRLISVRFGQFPDLLEDATPRLAGARITLEFRERFVKHLPFIGRGGITCQQIGLVEFGKLGEELGPVRDRQLGKLFNDFRFTHGWNLSRWLCSRKGD